MARSRASRPMAQSGVLQASRIQLIRGLVRTMTMPTSPPGLVSLPQVSSAVGRLFRWETHTGGDALADERRFQLGHGADDGEHGAAHGAVRVDLVLNAYKAHPEVVEFLKCRQQVAREVPPAGGA